MPMTFASLRRRRVARESAAAGVSTTKVGPSLTLVCLAFPSSWLSHRFADVAPFQTAQDEPEGLKQQRANYPPEHREQEQQQNSLPEEDEHSLTMSGIPETVCESCMPRVVTVFRSPDA